MTFEKWIKEIINPRTGKPYASASDGLYALRKAPIKYGMDIDIFSITDAVVIDEILERIKYHEKHKEIYNYFGNGQFDWALKKYKEYLYLKEDNVFFEDELDLNIRYEKQSIVLARRGQGTFREGVIKRCKTCPFTGIEEEYLLIASHIKPWKDAVGNEKIDPENGFAFTPTYDRLFDKGLITFDKNGVLYISNMLSADVCDRLGIYNKMQLNDLRISNKGKIYLEYHQDVVFRKCI